MRYIIFIILTLIGINTISYAEDNTSSDKTEKVSSNSTEQTESIENIGRKPGISDEDYYNEDAQRVHLGGND